MIRQIYLFVILTLLLGCHSANKINGVGQPRHLEYILTHSSKHKFSTDPVLSDYIMNQTFLGSVVGTLTRYKASGKYENFLLEDWTHSKDGLNWDLKLKPGLKTQMGHPIDFYGYTSGLKKLLKIYYVHLGDDIAFQYLEGYRAFVTGKSSELAGLKVISPYHLKLRFRIKPVDLYEILSMPYYGFHSESNFDSKGQWKDDRFIDSSGPYILSTIEPDKQELHLRARKGWFSINKKAPQTVHIKIQDFETLSLNVGNQIIYKRFKNLGEVPAGFSYLPENLAKITTYVLSDKKPPFNNVQNRQLLRYFVNSYLEKNPLDQLTSRSTTKMYPSFKDSSMPSDLNLNVKLKGNLKVYLPYREKGPQALKYQFGALDFALRKMGLNPEYHNLKELSLSESTRILRDNKEFHIRSASVVTDIEVKPSVIWMMFCTKMGVAFNDPSGRICKLTAKYQNSGDKDLARYTDLFQEILEEDSSVIPLYRYGLGWLISNSIKQASVSPVNVIPSFDLVEIE